jgi:hypothetical protein
MKELIDIQSKLKSPKDNRNNFGNYNYRSAEDILENVKPFLAENKCTLTITDDIIEVCGRVYVKATARLKNSTGEVEETTALAREEEVKKGMDAAQITGSASSYARKYALNGLFCIDDTKDPDATNTHGKETTELDDILAEIRSAKNESELKAAWNKHKDKDKHYNNKIKAVVNEMGDKLGLTKK